MDFLPLYVGADFGGRQVLLVQQSCFPAQAHFVAEVAEQPKEMDCQAHYVAEVAEQAAKMD